MIPAVASLQEAGAAEEHMLDAFGFAGMQQLATCRFLGESFGNHSPPSPQHIRTTSVGPGMLQDSPQSHTTKEKLEGKLEAER